MSLKRLFYCDRHETRGRIEDEGYESETEAEVAPIFREGSYRTPIMIRFRKDLIDHLEDWVDDYLVSEEGTGLRRQLTRRQAALDYKFEVEFEK